MFLVVILGSLVAGISLGSVFDDSAVNANVGRRPKDIIYKNKDGKQEGSFSIIYDSAKDSDSNGYYADEMPSSETEEDESDDDEEYFFKHEGDSSESLFVSSIDSGRRKTKNIDASTIEAEFVKHDKRGQKKEKKSKIANKNRNTINNKHLEKSTLKKGKTKVDNIDEKYKKGAKQVETKLKSKPEKITKGKIKKIGKIKARKLKKLEKKKKQDDGSDSEEFESKSARTKKKNGKIRSKKVQQKVEYDDADEEYDENRSAKNGKSRKVTHSMEERGEYDDDDDEEESNDNYVGNGDKKIQNESDDDYDYDELKKQLEDAETNVKADKRKYTSDSNYDEESQEKKGSNKKAKPFSKKNIKPVKGTEPKKGPTRKERKQRGKIHKISYGKRIGKSRVKDRRGMRGKRLFRGRRERRRPKEGMDSYKKTENTRIYNEDYQRPDPNARFGRNRQFREMVAKNRVKDYLKEERIRKAEETEKRERKKEKSPDKNMIKKQKMRKKSRIKKQRKDIGKLNQQRGTKVDKNKWKVQVNDFN